MVKLLPWQSYDFKRLGATKNSVTVQHMYRGMPIDGKIASARDIGNISAGMVAGWHGFSFNQAQPFFEALQGGKEANVTTEAEKYGIQKGLNLYDALDTNTKELESIRDSPAGSRILSCAFKFNYHLHNSLTKCMLSKAVVVFENMR